MRVAVVGATGLVGQKMLQVLEERSFPIDELIPVASQRSVGRELEFGKKKYTVVSPKNALKTSPDVALFSAGSSVSLEWAPKFADAGTWVIDNSSAWRMDPNIPLVVPEINFDTVTRQTPLIANPNCSTIQLVMVLNPIHKAFGLKRVIVSTYQAVTGTGQKAVEQLGTERFGEKAENPAYPYPIDMNCIPQCDVFTDNGYTKEEMKVVNESRKILGLPNLAVTATAVRVPVVGGHSESVYLLLQHPATREALMEVLGDQQGIVVQDDPSSNTYPMPLNAQDTDNVYVGRIRPDLVDENAVNLWIVADNLRKGAATNSIQIAELLIKRGLVSA